jgi:hypothetical protein
MHAGRSERLREPLGIVQGAILGVVGLMLAFGLTLAIDRYENRRDAVVEAANDRDDLPAGADAPRAAANTVARPAP